MSIRSTHKFNKRHKIVIAICTIALLLLNIGPYKVFTDPAVETEHRQCVELRKDPLCTQGGEIKAYELSAKGASLQKIKSYSTCKEYHSNPNMVEAYDSWWWGVCILIALVEAVVLFCLIVYGIIFGIKKFNEWLNTDYEDDEDDDEEVI